MEIVKFLVEKGADVIAENPYGQTALQKAASVWFNFVYYFFTIDSIH